MSTTPFDLDRVEIRELQPSDSLDELTELLHRAYAPLAAAGLKFLATHQDATVTRRRIGRGVCFVAVLDGAIIGTICYAFPENVKGSPFLDRPDVGRLGQFAVEPQFQRFGVGKKMFEHAENYARERGAGFMAVDTAEPATNLTEWYQRLGYEFVEYIQWDVTNYRSVILAKRLA